MYPTRPRALLSAALATAAIAALPGASPAHAQTPQTRTFLCPQNRAVTIAALGPDVLSAGPVEGGTMTFRRNSDNPFKFLNGEYVVILLPDLSKISFEIPDYGTVLCTYEPGVSADGRAGIGNTTGPGENRRRSQPSKPPPAALLNQRRAVAEQLPMSGRSLGGIVRAGPTQNSPRVRSMSENEELEIIERGPMWDNYNWFRVISGGQPGWQWGGIMCSSAPLSGIYQTCAQ